MILLGQTDRDGRLTFCGFSKKRDQYLYTGSGALQMCVLNLVKAVDEDIVFTINSRLLEMVYTELSRIDIITELRCEITRNKEYRAISFKKKGRAVSIKSLQSYLPLDENALIVTLGWASLDPITKDSEESLQRIFNRMVQDVKKIIKDLDFCLTPITKYW